jgi:uncharacterized membrane protein YoaK (UPF0700 family)
MIQHSVHKSERVFHENIAIGISLSMLGGFLDAYTYILKGGVFANAQTGNLVLFSLSVFSGDWYKARTYLIPIFMFALGILLSELLKSKDQYNAGYRRITMVLSAESLIIIIVGTVGKYIPNAIVNSIISFLAAVQVANFNKVNGSAVATTMITGNLRSAMVNAALFFKTKNRIYIENIITYASVIIAFGMGAVTGAFFSRRIQELGILVCLFFLLISYGIIRWEKKKY